MGKSTKKVMILKSILFNVQIKKIVSKEGKKIIQEKILLKKLFDLLLSYLSFYFLSF